MCRENPSATQTKEPLERQYLNEIRDGRPNPKSIKKNNLCDTSSTDPDAPVHPLRKVIKESKMEACLIRDRLRNLMCRENPFATQTKEKNQEILMR